MMAFKIFNWIMFLCLCYMAGASRFIIGKQEVYRGPFFEEGKSE